MRSATPKKATLERGNAPLFRHEVAASKQQQWLGNIVLARPLSFAILSSIAAGFALVLCLFVIFGKYTRKETVIGQIILSQGTAKIYSPVAGVVLRRFVKEGDTVVKGQALYTVSAERFTASKGNVQEEISQQISIRRSSLIAELAKQRSVNDQEELGLRQRIQGSQAELRQMNLELKTQKDRFNLALNNLSRFQELARQSYVSPAALHDHERDVLAQRAELESRVRAKLSIRKDISTLESELSNAPLKGENILAAIQRSLAELEEQALDNEGRREINVVSQVDGMVTAILVDAGQTVAQSTSLLGILPAGSRFEAALYVPSRAIGFIKTGNLVEMRYQPFPYQKFGQYGGTIKDVSRTALSPDDLRLLGSPAETFYRVIVALDSNKVIAYGEALTLQDGMQLEADIQIDTRRLYEWALEPLYTLTKRY